MNEDEKSLSELAVKLSNAKLEIDSLKEEQRQTLLASGLASWRDDGSVHQCPICAKEFSISKRKVPRSLSKSHFNMFLHCLRSGHFVYIF